MAATFVGFKFSWISWDFIIYKNLLNFSYLAIVSKHIYHNNRLGQLRIFCENPVFMSVLVVAIPLGIITTRININTGFLQKNMELSKSVLVR